MLIILKEALSMRLSRSQVFDRLAAWVALFWQSQDAKRHGGWPSRSMIGGGLFAALRIANPRTH